MDELMQEFLTDTTEKLNALDLDLVRLEKNPNDGELIGRIFRLVHTVKGNCGFLGLPRLENVTHHAESVLSQYRAGTVPVTTDSVSLILQSLDRIKGIVGGIAETGVEPPGEDKALIELLDMEAASKKNVPEAVSAFSAAMDDVSAKSVRISVETLEDMMTLMGELVLSRNQLLPHMTAGSKQPMQRMDKTVSALQQSMLKARMQPVGNLWGKLPRLVRDIAIDLGKKIRIDMTGGSTEVDRQVLELIRDPLMHLLRNAADHGIEKPAVRVTKGKPPEGVIHLSARHEGGQVIIDVADDGRGLDETAILQKAVEHKLIPATRARGMSPQQIQQLVFAPGFSTASEVTALSGRRVGMDVVRANIEKIGGTVELSSAAGKGAVVTMRIPLTLAIIPALVVKTDGERYAIPRNTIREVEALKRGGPHRIERINRAKFLDLRGQLVPLASLQTVFGADELAAKSLNPFVIILNAGSGVFGIICDGISVAEEIVVKPLSPALRRLRLFSGNAVLGDGGVVLILDPSGIAREAEIEPAPKQEAKEIAAPKSNGRAALLFRAGAGSDRAVPLEHLSRIERLDMSQVEDAGGRRVIAYRNGLLPLIAYHGVKGDKKRQPVLVIRDGDAEAGLIFDSVLGVVDALPEVAVKRESGSGSLGSALADGHAVDVVDAPCLIRQAREGMRHDLPDLIL
ncbi:MAG: chemotaxis protein CheA [bacterium]|nr:chemotaxis protein CheA [bacterium]